MESIVPEKKKRGRKAKISQESVLDKISTDETIVKIPKKRGRKPKGGKIIVQNQNKESESFSKMNIILHLKCSTNDLEKDEIHKQINNNAIFSNRGNDKLNDFNPSFDNYKLNKLNYTEFNNDITNTNNVTNNISEINVNYKTCENDEENKVDELEEKNETSSNKKNCNNNQQTLYNENTKSIWSKLEKLSNNLHYNNICNKKSACFYCTYDFDNVPISIPKHELNNTYYVYGCFCSPECACSYLMEEKGIDSATRFERYFLLNYIYCKIYNYNKNIKPAPNPYYTLDKFYGNLTIQEYRQLLKNERMLLVIDKPLSRILPEIHDDSDDFFLNSQTISNDNKFNLQENHNIKNKNNILNNQFNLKN